MFMPNRRVAALISMMVVAVLAGCSSGVKLNEVPVETRTPGATTPPPSGSSSGQSQSGVATVDLGKGAADTSLLGRVVYFDFDSFTVKDEFRVLVEGHAKALATNRQKRMVIEGHTDERGGREYNLALGQKRAEAVQRSMVLMGATDTQLESVSFGEERPLVVGSDEAAWAKNRRAELKDR